MWGSCGTNLPKTDLDCGLWPLPIAMASLTCSPECDGCFKLTQKVAELEKRISTLHQIQEHERDIDIILGQTMTAATSSQLASTELYLPGGSEEKSPNPSPISPVEFAAPVVPAIEKDRWLLQGAKPKLQFISTPTPLGSTAPSHRGAGKPSRDCSFRLPLNNKYSLLDEEDFPPLRRGSPPRPAGLDPTLAPLRSSHGCSTAPPTHRGKLLFTPAPRRSEAHHRAHAAPDGPHQRPHTSRTGSAQSARRRLVEDAAMRTRGMLRTRPPSSAESAPGSSALQQPGGSASAPGTASLLDQDPSVLVLGTSMVRHVRVTKAVTSCHPGAHVLDIRNSAPNLLSLHPSVSKVVLHAGTNDLKLEQSEKLKQDFISLISSILANNKQCIVSGPFCPPRFGNMKYSRLRSLHIFLKKHCMDNKIPYVDNFLSFFHRPELFKKDRLHPNALGSKLLSDNIQLTLESAHYTTD